MSPDLPWPGLGLGGSWQGPGAAISSRAVYGVRGGPEDPPHWGLAAGPDQVLGAREGSCRRRRAEGKAGLSELRAAEHPVVEGSVAVGSPTGLGSQSDRVGTSGK